MSLGFVPFSAVQEDLLRFFTVTECAPGYRPAKAWKRKTSEFTETQHQHFPERWAASEVSVALAQNTGLSQGVDLFKKKKKDLFIDGVPGARAGHCSLVGPTLRPVLGSVRFYCCVLSWG